ncbi:nuclear transport factor 2 family protein [Nostoc sp. CENA67]|uniref:Nuclear transport factor 2 family protein n=1 Tax=Amazonocrinis nigriterrae CENA67 TaxID=2794033 RepID=A0A8J7L766_9NOST|nr:nuclear transport factor 2 family protein [Amazonocrinis nigriterrae]MBH8563059.1 nuclear transport factor 2 family protein [Amazonocrinis nigriterrae CENA67]
MSNLAGTSTKTQIIKNLFEVLESGPNTPIQSSERYVTFLTESAQFRFGNFDTLVGHNAIKDSLVNFCQQVKSIYHDIKREWEFGDVVFLDMEVTYYRLDGTAVTLPVMDFFQFKGNLIQELGIYMDISPLFA